MRCKKSPTLPDNSKKFLTESEAAEMLAVTRRCVQAWRFRGVGPAHFKLGRAVRYRQTDLLEWLEGCRVEPSNGNGR